jgi:hypothetical protein
MNSAEIVYTAVSPSITRVHSAITFSSAEHASEDSATQELETLIGRVFFESTLHFAGSRYTSVTFWNDCRHILILYLDTKSLCPNVVVAALSETLKKEGGLSYLDGEFFMRIEISSKRIKKKLNFISRCLRFKL